MEDHVLSGQYTDLRIRIERGRKVLGFQRPFLRDIFTVRGTSYHRMSN